MARYYILLGALLAGVGVGMGAIGAHAIEGRLKATYGETRKTVVGIEIPAVQKAQHDWHTAAEYQMYHAFGLIVAGLLARQKRCPCLVISGILFLLGIVMFSGFLYAFALTNNKSLVWPIPIGGTLYVIGWFVLALGAIPKKAEANLVTLQCG